MAQLAYSVGVPAVILRYRQTRTEMRRWHGGKAVGLALGLPDFVHRWLPLLSSMGTPDGGLQVPQWATATLPMY